MRVLWLSIWLSVGLAKAQMPAANVNEALVSMARQAGVIFAGPVLSVKHGTELVEVRFLVEEAVRGCQAGEVYTLREWGSPLGGQGQRYLAGERSLMLLYAPGRGGISSPVGGQGGVIPIEGSTVDLRWVEATGVGVDRVSPVHFGPGSLTTRQSGSLPTQTGNYMAVMQILRTAVGKPIVHPIVRPISISGLPHVER